MRAANIWKFKELPDDVLKLLNPGLAEGTGTRIAKLLPVVCPWKG
jgi:hypothetical protein